MYVHKGCTIHVEAWRSEGWRDKRGDISNADLWKKLYGLLMQSGGQHIAFTKVMAHA